MYAVRRVQERDDVLQVSINLVRSRRYRRQCRVRDRRRSGLTASVVVHDSGIGSDGDVAGQRRDTLCTTTVGGGSSGSELMSDASATWMRNAAGLTASRVRKPQRATM